MSIREDPYLALPPGIRLRNNGTDVGQITSLDVVGANASAVVNNGTLTVAAVPVATLEIRDDGVDEGNASVLDIVGPELSVSVLGPVATFNFTPALPSGACVRSGSTVQSLGVNGIVDVWKTDVFLDYGVDFTQNVAGKAQVLCSATTTKWYRIAARVSLASTSTGGYDIRIFPYSVNTASRSDFNLTSYQVGVTWAVVQIAPGGVVVVQVNSVPLKTLSIQYVEMDIICLQ